MTTDPSPVAPDYQTYIVTVGAEITWNGYVLSCSECGSTSSWALHVRQPRWTRGEDAWATCERDHEVRHPLIYPAFVHTMIGWVESEAGQPLNERLDALPWMPHRMERINAEWSDEDSYVWWWPAGTTQGGSLLYWRHEYPDLARAAGWI